MTERPPFEADERPPALHEDQLILDLGGFEGPLDVLLTLARDQKVDLTRISILRLADQYLAFVSRARQLRLELAADYLVMGAWLAYLKSRLLLPPPRSDEEPSGAEMAAALAFQLQRLEAMREASSRLFARPQLDRDVFARGEPEAVEVSVTNVFEVSLFDLLKAYGDRQRRQKAKTLTIAPLELYSLDEALERLRRLLGRTPDWQTLASFLPPGMVEGLTARSAVAATLSATLELARSGRLSLRQDRPFGPIYLRRREET